MTTLTARPASPKQIAYARSLVQSRALDPETALARLEHLDDVEAGRAHWTSAQASAAIEGMIALPRAGRSTAPSEGLRDGMYTHQGRIVKVQHAVHGSGRQYAKVLNTTDGTWTYAAGLVHSLSPADALTPERAREYGQLYGMCVVCGATLTDETSIEAGIGPVCAGRL